MVKQPSTEPLSDGSHIAFGIKETGPNQRHVVLVFKSAKLNGTAILHHAWHKCTRVDEWDASYFTVGIRGLDPELQETFADWAEDIVGRIEETPIPYGVFYNLLANFNSETGYVDRDDHSGHTCATFLLDLFSSYKIPLLDLCTWPESRPGDAEWGAKIMGYLQNSTDVAQDYLALQYAYFAKMRRFRPEEIAGGAILFVGEKLPFDKVAPLGEYVLHEMAGA